MRFSSYLSEQTYEHTNTEIDILITILCTPPSSEVIMALWRPADFIELVFESSFEYLGN